MMRRFRRGAEDKPTWRSVPAEVRAEAERVLGRRVLVGRRIWGGYSPSPTFRLTLEGGDKAFRKASNAAIKESNPGADLTMSNTLRTEIRVYSELPAIRPWAPRMLGTADVAAWRILLLEFVQDVRGVGPWTPVYVRRASEALASFHNSFAGSTLPAWVPAAESGGWRTLIEDPESLVRVANLAGRESDEAAEWFEGHTARFAELESGILDSPGPTSRLQGDVRSDNLLFRGDGSVVMVDWPLIRHGPGVRDVVAFANSVTAEAGPEPEETVVWYAAASHAEIVQDDLIAAVADLTGFFFTRAGLPEIPGLPRVSVFQRAQLVTSLRWLTRMLGLPEPGWLSSIYGTFH